MAKTPEQKPQEDKSQIQKELDATKIVYDALLSVPVERRGPIIRAVALLLNIYIPGAE